MRQAAAVFALGALAAVSSCGGGTPPAPSDGGSGVTTVTITSGGASPVTLTINQGERVLFVNNDSRPHNMTSDPHPDHDQPGCGALNAVGFLSPGQRRETGNLTTAGTCGFHDHDDPPPAGSRFTGRITIR
jgi:plastocyanin